MTVAALGLVLAAAFLHATWNLLAKRAGGGAGVVWLYGTVSAALLTPPIIAMAAFQPPRIDRAGLVYTFASVLLHVAYFVALQKGYQLGELSVVYPIARGTSPVLATAGAVVLLGERPSAIALLGVGLVAVGVFTLAKPDRAIAGNARRAVAFGLLTGALIAGYTLCDQRAVARHGIPPLVQQWASSFGLAILLAPWAFRYREDVRALWKTRWREVVGIGVLVPAGYVLVLFAMTISPLSHVAPAREISILFATLMGTHFLSENRAGKRLSAALMVVGVIALALG